MWNGARPAASRCSRRIGWRGARSSPRSTRRNWTGGPRIAPSSCCMRGRSQSRRCFRMRGPALAGGPVSTRRGRMATRAAACSPAARVSGSRRARWRCSRSRPARACMPLAARDGAALPPPSSTGWLARRASAPTGTTSTARSTPFRTPRSRRCWPIWALPLAATPRRARALAALPIGRAGASCRPRSPAMRARQSRSASPPRAAACRAR